MNRRFSWIGALFLISCVWAASASDPKPSPYTSRLSLPDGAKMRVGKGQIYSVAYSPDSRRIAAASSIGVWIYDADFGKEIALLRGHTRRVNSAAYSPDGTRIVSASDDKTVRIWDAKTGAILKTLKGHTRQRQFSGVLARRQKDRERRQRQRQSDSNMECGRRGASQHAGRIRLQDQFNRLFAGRQKDRGRRLGWRGARLERRKRRPSPRP